MKPTNQNVAPVIVAGGFSIQTKYLPATDKTGGRIKAWRVDRLNGRTETVVCPFDYSAACPHSAAAIAWFEKHGKLTTAPAWHLVKGAADKGHLFTIVFNS
jgi:hypothetical protein